ncbi:ThiF family adenylyltransferase [Pseudomonadota bacterium]
MNNPELSTDQLSRYSRHILLPEIDIEGQENLQASSVTLIGAGGLGSPAAMYLASSGVGRITIFDHDQIDVGNLQRQIAYKTKDIGHQKAQQLKNCLSDINPEIKIEAYNTKATQQTLTAHAPDTDVIIDASDNFATRFILNKTSLATSTPLISGAAISFAGQATVFDPATATSPCYHCLYTEEDYLPQDTCRDHGVFAPLTGIIGSILAAEAIKFITNKDTCLIGRLLLFNAKSMTSKTVKLPKDPLCPACGNSAAR